MIAGHGYKRGLRALRQLIRDSIASLTERKREDDLSVPPESVKRTGAVYESLMSDCGVTQYAREKGLVSKRYTTSGAALFSGMGFPLCMSFD